MRFRAKQDFYSTELVSSYCAGLLYTIRPPDVVLAQLVPQWLEENKIEMVPNAESMLSGTAEVQPWQ